MPTSLTLTLSDIVTMTASGVARESRFSAWRHQVETFFALPAICAGNSPVTGGFSQRSMTRSFDVFVDLRQNKRLSKQLRRWWFETRHPAHYDVNIMFDVSLSKPLNKKNQKKPAEIPIMFDVSLSKRLNKKKPQKTSWDPGDLKRHATHMKSL